VTAAVIALALVCLGLVGLVGYLHREHARQVDGLLLRIQNPIAAVAADLADRSPASPLVDTDAEDDAQFGWDLPVDSDLLPLGAP